MDLAGGEEHRGGRRVRELPRLLDAGLPAAQRAFRRPRQAARARRRRARARDARAPRRGDQPRRPAVLLRHQRQRRARRHAVGRRVQPHVPADLPEPRARRGVQRRRADLLQPRQGLPRADHRVGSRVRPARRAGVDLARVLGAGGRPVHGLAGDQPHAAAASAGVVRVGRREAVVRRSCLVQPARPRLRVVARGRLLDGVRARAGDDRRLPGRAQGPRYRSPRRAGGADPRVRVLDRGRGLRRVPDRHGEAHRSARDRSQPARVLGRVHRPDAREGGVARQAELLPVRRGVRRQGRPDRQLHVRRHRRRRLRSAGSTRCSTSRRSTG